jgi:SulP family sulfate permease
MAFLERHLPFLRTVRGYRRSDLRPDLTAGLTTAVMLIPQAMAYAMLAGLPPIVGLYASVVPLALYALFGSSRELAVGPVAMVSLLVATGVGALAPVGSADFIAYAVLLAGMVGVLQLAMGVARAGFLVNFLSHPVISGFTSAAALIIGFSQLKHLLGVDIARSHHVHAILASAFGQLANVSLPTVILGAGSVIALVLLKRWNPVFPRALAVVVGGSVAVWALGLADRGVAIVGNVPAGFPSPSLPGFDSAVLLDLLPIAITIALVGFMESISVAKAFARRNRYDVDPNQELVGLGVANIGGALFGAYPVTGGFSRTAVNAQAGARSTLASLITAVVIALTLLLFTPAFYYLPKAVLAAIIMTAVFGLVDVAEVRHLWKVKRSDLALLVTTFAATLSLGIEQGILIGVGASLLWFVVRTTRPHTAVLGRRPDGSFRNVARHDDAETIDGVAIVRMDASFYFGNVTFLKDTLRQLEQASATPLRAVILDASAINNLDSSADAALNELLDDYQPRDIQLILARVKGPVMDVLERSGFAGRAGDAAFAESVQEAVASLPPAPRDRPSSPDVSTSRNSVATSPAPGALPPAPGHLVPAS